MSRAIFALLTFSFLLLTVACAKQENSSTPATAQAAKRTSPPAGVNRNDGSKGASLSVGVMDDGRRPQDQENSQDTEQGKTADKSEGETDENQKSDEAEATTEPASTEESAETSGTKVMIADGGMQLIVPEGWKEATPASNMIEVEFSVPGEDETTIGRVTGMLAGGSVEANVDRWYDQFVQPDGSATKDSAKLGDLEVGALKIHTVDIPGTFLEGMGPIAPKTERENYRMLAAIIELEGDFNYFLKFTGPAELIEKHAEGFMEMLKGIKSAD